MSVDIDETRRHYLAGGVDVLLRVAHKTPHSHDAAVANAEIGGVPRRAGFIADHRRAMLTHAAKPEDDALSGHQRGYWLAMIRGTMGIMPAAGAEEVKLEPAKPHWEKMRAWLGATRISP